MGERSLVLAAALLSFGYTAHGAEPRFPTKPIRVIIPTAPGGGSDLMMRMLGNKWTDAWGEQVVLDHRPGGGMTLGIGITAQANPDGHTLALVNPSHAINATLMPKLAYDPLKDLSVLTVTATQPYAMTITNSVPAKTVKEFIAYAKSKPGELNMASSGPGSASHLAGEMFKTMTGVNMIHVPYKGTGFAMPDLISGRMHFYVNPMLAMITQIQAGRIRLLAVTSPKRIASMPDVPTVDEAGVPGYQATSWYMLITPARVPVPVMNKLYDETAKALKSKDIVQVLAQGGSEPVGDTPRASTEFLKAEIARWGKVIKQANVTVQ